MPEDLDEPGALARILEAVRGAPFEERLHEAALRSMSQARYEPTSQGHYALRFEHYLHFTSPIRRYADLEVHRALRELIRGDSPRARAARTGASTARPPPDPEAESLAAWLSGRERVAQEAERDAEALAACALMAGREGERFAARVTGASPFGVFVRLEAPAVSGLVPMRELHGEWVHDEEQDAIVRSDGQGRLSVGESIHVRLAEIDVDRARMSFGILGRLAADRRRAGRGPFVGRRRR